MTPELDESNRDRLVTAAERLFAEHGVDGISLRAIGAAARQGNSVAIQYHFGDKYGLVTAIFARRTPQLEALRAKLLAEAFARGPEPDVRALVETQFRPLAELEGSDGRNIYARFLLQHLDRSDLWKKVPHPLRSSASNDNRDEASATLLGVLLICQRLSHIPASVVRARITLLLRMFLGALIHRENALAHGDPAWPMEALLADQFDLIAAALAQPLSAPVVDWLGASASSD